MKIIVTGADGFIGGHLVQKLIKCKHELFLIGEDKQKLNELCDDHYVCLSHIGLKQEDLVQKIQEFCPETIIHLAAYSVSSDSYEELEKLFSANILFLGKILDAIKCTSVKHFIYTGSCTEYYKGNGDLNPAYLYSATKTAGRTILGYYSGVYNYKSIIVTLYTVYGGISKQKKILDILYDSLDSDNPVNTTLGEQVLDFIYISDLVELYCKILENIDKIPDKTDFHAGTGEGNSIRRIAALLEESSGKKCNVIWGGIPYRKNDIMYAVADIEKPREILNWVPIIKLEEGLKMYVVNRVT